MQNNFQFPVSNWSLYYVVHIVDCTCSCNNNNIGNQRKNIFVNNAIIDDDIIGRTSTTTSTRYLVDMNYELRSTVIRLKIEKKVESRRRPETKRSTVLILLIDPILPNNGTAEQQVTDSKIPSGVEDASLAVKSITDSL